MRENVTNKAARYLAEHRLTVEYVRDNTIAATCRGSGQLYRLGHDRNRGWWCDCRTEACSHLTALQSVTVRTT